MPTERHYSRAPITEAVLDIRAQLPPWQSVEALGAVHVDERDRYPHRKEIRRVSGEFMSTAEGSLSASTHQSVIGYRFTSKDDRQLFQARLDGFAFNRLEPYERW